MTKAFLIDPFDRTITAFQYKGEIQQIYDLIGNNCERFYAICINGKRDNLYVDHYLLQGHYGEMKTFRHIRYHSPIVGRGIILGHDLMGDSCDPYVDLVTLQREIEFL